MDLGIISACFPVVGGVPVREDRSMSSMLIVPEISAI